MKFFRATQDFLALHENGKFIDVLEGQVFSHHEIYYLKTPHNFEGVERKHEDFYEEIQP